MSEVTIINRTQAEITLCADIVKTTKATPTEPARTIVEPALIKFTRKSRLGSEVEAFEDRVVTLPGMPKGSFSTNPVTMAAADWARLSKSKVVQALLASKQLEAS